MLFPPTPLARESLPPWNWTSLGAVRRPVLCLEDEASTLPPPLADLWRAGEGQIPLIVLGADPEALGAVQVWDRRTFPVNPTAFTRDAFIAWAMTSPLAPRRLSAGASLGALWDQDGPRALLDAPPYAWGPAFDERVMSLNEVRQGAPTLAPAPCGLRIESAADRDVLHAALASVFSLCDDLLPGSSVRLVLDRVAWMAMGDGGRAHWLAFFDTFVERRPLLVLLGLSWDDLSLDAAGVWAQRHALIMAPETGSLTRPPSWPAPRTPAWPPAPQAWLIGDTISPRFVHPAA